MVRCGNYMDHFLEKDSTIKDFIEKNVANVDDVNEPLAQFRDETAEWFQIKFGFKNKEYARSSS